MNARRIKRLPLWNMRSVISGVSSPCAFSSGMFRNCISSVTRIPTSRAASNFSSGGRKNREPEMKISPKEKHHVLVLFLAAAVASPAQTLRLEKSADAMGSAFSVVLYGDDRLKLEAAADAALDEAKRL